MNKKALYRRFNTIRTDWMKKPREEILSSLKKVPKDRAERSLFQYLESVKQENPWKHFLKNVASFFLLIPLFFLVFKKVRFIESFDALDRTVLKETMPESIKIEFPKRIETAKKALTFKDLAFFYKNVVFKAPFRFFYQYNILRNLANVRYAKDAYRVKAVLSGIEYSFISSLLTEFCEKEGMEHINMMHGDKLLNPRDSYVSFSRFYVFDEYYKELFSLLKGEASFVVEAPSFLHSAPLGSYTTYYLQKEDEEKMKIIAQALLQMDSPVAVRPHPRFSDMPSVERAFKGIEIEKNLSIEESLTRAKTVISVYSTVLFQGYKMGRSVIVDDLSDPEKITELRELGYIMLNKPHTLWSSYVRNLTKNG
ncbi:hypothetical protein [Guggenheimella bovis]